MPKDQKDTSVGSVAIATLVGGAVGAFVSLMLAPKSGNELRQDIQSKVGGIIEQVGDTTFQSTEALKKRSTDFSEKGKQLKANIQILIKDLKQKKPAYIDITLSAPEETSLQPEPVPEPVPEPEPEPVPVSDSPEFLPTETTPHEEISTVYL